MNKDLPLGNSDMPGELEIIDRIRRAIPFGGAAARAAGLTLGVGDDAALLRSPGRFDWVVSCDAFLEDAHFLRRAHPPEAVGYKALARATSDLAAMGAQPRFFLLVLALPARLTGRWMNGFLSGLGRAARKFRMSLIGGDTSQNPKVAVGVTVLGQAPRGRSIARAGARPGDLIYVSGRLGAAQLGLELVLRRLHRQKRFQPLLRAHLYPEPRLELGAWLAARGFASAMIDTSDGLSTDLWHLARASGTGSRIWRSQLPMVRVPAELRAQDIQPAELALRGGEDYELLFTVPRHLAAKIPAAYRGVALTRIGEMIRQKEIWLDNSPGRATRLAPRGWDHFRE